MTDVLYPRRCPVCEDILTAGLIHKRCEQSLNEVGDVFCMKCGKPLENPGMELCHQCSITRHAYDEGRALWIYDEAMHKVIIAFKYHFKREYGEFIYRSIVRRFGGYIRGLKADAVIPVPVSDDRKRFRGYNQAEDLAKGVAGLLGLQLDVDLLKRKKNTLPQKSLNRVQRVANLKSSMIIEKSDKKYDTVLIIDDIYTTGATMDACAQLLKSAGVKKVYFIAVSIGTGDI